LPFEIFTLRNNQLLLGFSWTGISFDAIEKQNVLITVACGTDYCLLESSFTDQTNFKPIKQ
jgi:hypothetical protein